MKKILLLSVFLLTACEKDDYKCIDGFLYFQYPGGTWVKDDGTRHINQPYGPMPCQAKDAK